MRPYPGGVIQERRSQETGTRILVVANAQYGTDDSEPYSTICDQHGSICSHPTLTLARQHAGAPTGWCSACADVLEGKCRDCGLTPGPRPSAQYGDTGRLPGTCDTCNLAYSAS